MVDITVEILASSVLVQNGYRARYRIKTWWAHIDVPPELKSIKLPRLPMIQSYLHMNGKDTTIFVETWEDYWGDGVGDVVRGGEGSGGSPRNKSRFMGITTCSVDEQLNINTKLNPSVQWLPVYDPIENTQRGKLLLKVDAKYALPTTDNNNEENIPTKIGDRNNPSSQFSRSELLHPNYCDFSPTKNSAISRVSRKSDTSLFSVGSASSTRSHDRGVQTDLSLPVLPDISKYTAALRTHSMSEEDSGQSCIERRRVSRKNIKSVSDASSPIVDPLQVAQDLLLKGNSSKFHRRNSDTSSKPAPSSTAFRRTCLVKQHIQQQQLPQTPPNTARNDDRHFPGSTQSGFYDNDHSIEHVIDILNVGMNGVFTSSVDSVPTTGQQKRISRDRWGSEDSSDLRNVNSKPPIPKPTFSKQDGNDKFDVNIRKLDQGGNSLSDRERVPTGNKTRNTRSPTFQDSRFKEVHFDGAQATQQASLLIMTKTTQPTTQCVSHPPVTRRRIAAAIFND